MPALVELSLQIIDALLAGEQQGFHTWSLSLDNIYVYESSQGTLHYRLTNIGQSQLFALAQSLEESYKVMMKPETLPPELYQMRPLGHITTQFILGNLICHVIFNHHPYEDMSLIQANNHHLSGALKQMIHDHQGLPVSFKRWLIQLLQPEPQHRFPSLHLASTMLKQSSGI